MSDRRAQGQRNADAKAMTIRLPSDQSAELEKIAQIDGVSIAEAVREAVTGHIAARRNDPTFRRRVHDIIEKDRLILQRLAE